MKPIYFKDTDKYVLADCISCTVTEERNGAYEMEFEYPITGQYYDQLELMGIVLAKANPTSANQYFRINRITKPLNGIVTVYCYHISYDLSGIPVSPFTAGSVTAAIAQMKSSSAVTNPFTYWTDKDTSATMTVTVPSSSRALLGGQDGSLLDVYGGEYEFDNYTVKLHASRGSDRGVSIRYGKNLTSLTQDENCASVYTGVYPYWADSDGNLTQLSEKIVNVEGTFGFVRIMPLDLSSEWETAPTEDQLRARAKTYIKDNNVGVPDVNLKVSFVQLENTEEYKGKALLERVDLCDTVTVQFDKLGVNATAQCIKTTYNSLLERYDSIELGDAKASLATTISTTQTQAAAAVSGSAMAKAIANATKLITGNLGGYVVMHDSDGSGTPDEILIMDTDDITTATKVWRWNQGGLGYSSKGYDGDYTTAITQDGAIVADFITTGLLNANLIKSGTITNDANNMSIDVTNGIIKTTDTRFDTTGAKTSEYSGISTVYRNGSNAICYYGVGANGDGNLSVSQSGGSNKVTLDGETGKVTATGDISAKNVTAEKQITAKRYDLLNSDGTLVVSFNSTSSKNGYVALHNTSATKCLQLQVADSVGSIWIGNGESLSRVLYYDTTEDSPGTAIQVTKLNGYLCGWADILDYYGNKHTVLQKYGS